MTLGTEAGVVRAYAIKRMDEAQRWDGNLVKKMRGTPQKPDPSKPGIFIPIRVTFDEPEKDPVLQSEPMRKERGSKRMKISRAILSKYGYTSGCDACRVQRAGLAQAGHLHSETCRSRIETAMEGDEEGQEILRREKEKEDQNRSRG